MHQALQEHGRNAFFFFSLSVCADESSLLTNSDDVFFVFCFLSYWSADQVYYFFFYVEDEARGKERVRYHRRVYSIQGEVVKGLVSKNQIKNEGLGLLHTLLTDDADGLPYSTVLLERKVPVQYSSQGTAAKAT